MKNINNPFTIYLYKFLPGLKKPDPWSLIIVASLV
jgi:hypothetical protein